MRISVSIYIILKQIYTVNKGKYLQVNYLIHVATVLRYKHPTNSLLNIQYTSFKT